MDKVYLAPCPFCAGHAKKEEYDPYDGYQGRNTVYKVRCRECGATVKADSYDEAVRKWNQRAVKMSDNDLISRKKLLHTLEGWLKVNARVVPTEIGKAVYMMIEDYPAVPHEMGAVEYLQTMRPICEDGRNCGKCPLSYNNNGAGINCQDYVAYHPEEAVAIVEAWAQEHPEERSEE